MLCGILLLAVEGLRTVKSAIIEKLQSELAVPIENERQVVYVLVEVRKVIEQTKEATGRNPFPSLELYCNWAVHPWLDRKPAKELLKKLDSLYSKLFGCGLNEEDHSQLSSILNFENFRAELGQFLNEHELPTELSTDKGQWLDFLKWYSRVIEDCPLVCRSRDAALEKVDEVVFSKANQGYGTPELDHNVAGFNIEWRFLYRGRSAAVLVLTPDHKLLGSTLYTLN